MCERKTITCNGDVFELVDFVPGGYRIWNIGENMPDGYLPLCRLSARQPVPGGRNIETDTLKAIKTDGAQTILRAASAGPGTLKEMEAFIKRYTKAKPGSYYHGAVERVKKALPLMRQIKWN